MQTTLDLQVELMSNRRRKYLQIFSSILLNRLIYGSDDMDIIYTPVYSLENIQQLYNLGEEDA